MKRSFFLLLAVLALQTSAVKAQSGWGVVKEIYKGVRDGNSGSGSIGSLSSTEIVNGLKEALNVGSKNASGKLNVVNGFFGNAIIKVLMPPEAQKVENTL